MSPDSVTALHPLVTHHVVNTLGWPSLRALLGNNLHRRLESYGSLVGRRVGMWHGDVSESQREAVRAQPPDVLLTTPESVEASSLVNG